jgi:hypothetical protein
MTVVAERRPTIADARSALQKLGRATRKDVAEFLGCSKWVATRLVDELVDEGAVRSRAFEMTGRRGRPAPLFELVPQRRVAAVALASGVALDLSVDVTPMKGRKKPMRAVTADEIAPPPPKPRARTRKPKAPKNKIMRRKGKHGVDRMVQTAEELGYTVSLTKKGHFRFSKPGSATVYGPGTPSDFRSVKNTVAQLKRAA